MKIVEIVAYDNDEVIKTFGPHPDFSAEKIQAGLNINLNHEKYYTRMVDVDEENNETQESEEGGNDEGTASSVG